MASLTGTCASQKTPRTYGCTPIYPNDRNSQALPVDRRSISLFGYVDEQAETSLGLCCQRSPECRC